MQKLNDLLESSYESHPAFSFKTTGWEVSQEALAAFNQAYEAVRGLHVTLDKKSFATARNDCLEAFNHVFLSMQSQCSDEFEERFLAELKSECIKLLNEELIWFAKRPHTHFVNLAKSKLRLEALGFQSDRHFFGQLPQRSVDEILTLAAKSLDGFRANMAAGKLTRGDLSVNSGANVRAIRDVLNREFKSLGVLDIVSSYAGRKIRVSGLALELSVPQATWWKNAIKGLNHPPKTLYAHLDEGIAFPKSIVYLSNVTEQNGPTSCYPGAYEAMALNPLQELIGRVVGNVGNNSASPLRTYYAKQYHQSVNSENFRRHFMRLPESLRFNSHMGWDVLPGCELEKRLVFCEKKMTGPAGTFIVFDGARLLHRGGLIDSGERIALQVIFSDLTLIQHVSAKIKRIFS
jgi:hypothetical protein